jgi:hypothetical protein
MKTHLRRKRYTMKLSITIVASNNRDLFSTHHTVSSTAKILVSAIKRITTFDILIILMDRAVGWRDAPTPVSKLNLIISGIHGKIRRVLNLIVVLSSREWSNEAIYSR